MSDLELLGYLEQPHTSAGRVPSAQAYRFYVDSMIEPDTLDDNDRTLINTLYREQQRSIDDIFLSTAKILSQMTHNVSMVLANQHSVSRFCYLKFLPLDTVLLLKVFAAGYEPRHFVHCYRRRQRKQLRGRNTRRYEQQGA